MATRFDDLGLGRDPPSHLRRHCIYTVHPPAMSKVDSSSTNQPTKEDAIPGLGVLEEDDEFEEFPTQGKHAHVPNFRSVSYASFTTRSAGRCTFDTLDWDDSQTDLANLAGAGAAGSAAGGDKLWEDNWDDDDIEEEFSTQLRFVVLSYPTCTYSLIPQPLLGRNLKRQNRAPTPCSIDCKTNPDGMRLNLELYCNSILCSDNFIVPGQCLNTLSTLRTGL